MRPFTERRHPECAQSFPAGIISGGVLAIAVFVMIPGLVEWQEARLQGLTATTIALRRQRNALQDVAAPALAADDVLYDLKRALLARR
jgi:hypothetical protein